MKKTMIALACLLLLAGACWSQDSETNGNEVKYYDNAKVVRIKNVDGEGFVQRSYEEGNEEATANLPLFEKDTVGTSEGRLGIYLGRLNYLRLDADSTVVLEKIPQLRKTDLSVRVENGGIYLDIESLDNERGIEVQTPDCGVFILDKGVYRVNVSPDAQTEVLVMEGIAEVTGRESSRNVRENQKIVMAGGEIAERPYYFTASEKDDFDSWNEAQNRELSYANYGTSRYLQSGYEDTEYEMSRSGRWSYMPEYSSYAWMPYNAGPDWMPYANGRWVWNPFYGYTWVSYDSCGWFTHHYGRWQWDYSFGWYWIPGYHWSPAWVSWFGDSNYYGWCPLSWWNRPVVVINNRWDRHYDYRHGIPFHSRSTIIIRKNELSAANAQRVALNRSALGRNSLQNNIAYRGTAPSERLALGKVTVLNSEGRTMSYKQGGLVSTEKYRPAGTGPASGRAMEFKYNPAGRSTYSSRAYGKKNSEGLDRAAGGNARYGSESAAGFRSRYSSSGSTEKATAKTSYGSRAKNSSSQSTSSSSSSAGSTEKAKKKKDAPAYMAGAGYGQGNTEKASASTYARYQSQYSGGAVAANRSSYRVYESRFKSMGSANAGSYSAGTGRYRNESADYAAGLASGRYSGGSLRSNSSARFSIPDSAYRSSRSTASEYLGSNRGSGSGASYNRDSGSRAAVRSYTPAASSQSFHSSHSSYSAPSSTHTGTAVHKKDRK